MNVKYYSPNIAYTCRIELAAYCTKERNGYTVDSRHLLLEQCRYSVETGLDSDLRSFTWQCAQFCLSDQRQWLVFRQNKRHGIISRCIGDRIPLSILHLVGENKYVSDSVSGHRNDITGHRVVTRVQTMLHFSTIVLWYFPLSLGQMWWVTKVFTVKERVRMYSCLCRSSVGRGCFSFVSNTDLWLLSYICLLSLISR